MARASVLNVPNEIGCSCAVPIPANRDIFAVSHQGYWYSLSSYSFGDSKKSATRTLRAFANLTIVASDGLRLPLRI